MAGVSVLGTRNAVFGNVFTGGLRVMYGAHVSLLLKSRSYSRRSVGVILVVGVLAGLTVGGGVGVIAASSTKTVTVCANKTTNMLRYAKGGTCFSTETKVVLNQTGAKGSSGAKGAKGATGARGATGAAGSSFTARSVCGSDGTTLCAVGVQGPGGGTVFYVDTEGRYGDFDYLEFSPADASSPLEWSTATLHCGLSADTDCQSAFLTTSGEALNYVAMGTGRAATASIIARHDAGGVSKALYAAGIAVAYTTPTASDWFLPSQDELNEVCKYARNTGQAASADTVCAGGILRDGFSADVYWSSSENADANAWSQDFSDGKQYDSRKFSPIHVRPVRAF